VPDTTTGSYAYVPKLGSIPHSAEMVWLYDGTFFNVDYGPTGANRINARHDKFTKTNLLFFDGHAGNVRHCRTSGRNRKRVFPHEPVFRLSRATGLAC